MSYLFHNIKLSDPPIYYPQRILPCSSFLISSLRGQLFERLRANMSPLQLLPPNRDQFGVMLQTY